MDRNELIENLRTTLLWETVCAHIERGNEADVILQKAGVENGIAAERAEIQDTDDLFVTDVCESGGSQIRSTAEHGIDIAKYYAIGALEKAGACEYAKQLGQTEIERYLGEAKSGMKTNGKNNIFF